MSLTLDYFASKHLAQWLGEQNLALVISLKNQLLVVWADAEARLGMEVVPWPGVGAVEADHHGLWVAGAHQAWRLQGVAVDGERQLWVPQMGYTTGAVGIRDWAQVGDHMGFASTSLNCLGLMSHRHSFELLWVPPFLSRMFSEPVVFLTSFTASGDEVRYIALGCTAQAPGQWHGAKAQGLIWDASSQQALVSGLSWPHALRMASGLLWFVDAGTGFLCCFDPLSGEVQQVFRLPGYPQAMTLHQRHVVIATSIKPWLLPAQMPLGAALAAEGRRLNTAVAVVDVLSGRMDHWLRFEKLEQIFDVALIHAPHRPQVLTPEHPDLARFVSVGPLVQRDHAAPTAEDIDNVAAAATPVGGVN